MEVQIIQNTNINNRKENISFGLIDDGRLLGQATFSMLNSSNWLAILDEIQMNKYYRGMKLGSFLLRESERMLSEAGIQRICCAYSALSAEDKYANFLKQNYYSEISEQYIVLSYKLKEIKKTAFFGKLPMLEKLMNNISSLENVEPRLRRKYFEQLIMKDIDFDLSHVNETFTKLYVKNDEIKGILLCEKITEEIRVQDYYVEEGKESNIILLTLLGDVIKAMISNGMDDEFGLKFVVYHKNILNGIEETLGKDHRIGMMKGFVKIL